MRINKIEIDNFGKLSNYIYVFQSGLNLIETPNGSGKSTTVAFILAMFYGLESTGRKDSIRNERSRYKPWQGGRMGGSLTFECEGREYVITRYWGEKPSMDHMEVRNAVTNVVTDILGDRPGEVVFGLDRESFMRTCLRRQSEMNLTMTDGISSRLGGTDGIGFDMEGYDNAIEVIKDNLNHLSPSRKTGAIRRTRDEIAGLKSELGAEKRVRASLEECRTMLRRLAEEKSDKEEEIAELGRFDREADGESDENRKRYDGGESGDEDLRGEYPKRDEEDEYDSILWEAGRPRVWERGLRFVLFLMVVAVIIFVMAATGIVIIPSLEKEMAVGLAGLLSAFIVLDSVVLYKGYRRRRRKIERLRAEEADSRKIKSLRTEEADSRRIERLRTEEADSRKRRTDLRGEITFAIGELNDIMSKIKRLEKQQDSLVAELKKFEGYKADIEECSARLNEQEKLYKAYVNADRYLRKARSDISEGFMEPLLNSFRQYYSEATGEDGNDYRIDENGKITRIEYGIQRDGELLSQGNRDLNDLMLRLAYVDIIFSDNKPVLIFDDPFVNLDDDRLHANLDLMRRVSEKYQVIYFTCRRNDYGR